MNKRTPAPGYRKLKLKDNHYQTPCKSAEQLLKDIDLVRKPKSGLPKPNQTSNWLAVYIAL